MNFIEYKQRYEQQNGQGLSESELRQYHLPFPGWDEHFAQTLSPYARTNFFKSLSVDDKKKALQFYKKNTPIFEKLVNELEEKEYAYFLNVLKKNLHLFKKSKRESVLLCLVKYNKISITYLMDYPSTFVDVINEDMYLKNQTIIDGMLIHQRYSIFDKIHVYKKLAQYNCQYHKAIENEIPNIMHGLSLHFMNQEKFYPRNNYFMESFSCIVPHLSMNARLFLARELTLEPFMLSQYPDLITYYNNIIDLVPELEQTLIPIFNEHFEIETTPYRTLPDDITTLRAQFLKKLREHFPDYITPIITKELEDYTTITGDTLKTADWSRKYCEHIYQTVDCTKEINIIF